MKSVVKFLGVAFAVVYLCVSSPASQLDDAMLSIQQAIQAGDLDAATASIDSSLVRYPNEGGLYNLCGIVHAQRNELPQAHRDFGDAVRLAPRLIPAWQNFARSCRLGTEQDASLHSCAFSATERVLELKPDDIEARSAMALLDAQEGRFAASLRQLNILPADEASRVPNQLVRCADLAGLGRNSEEKTLASRLAQNPAFSEADFTGVQTAFDSPKTASALVPLLEDLDSKHAAGVAALRKLAIAYEQVQRPTDARKTLERVAMLDPGNPSHLLELARLAEAAKDHEGALGYLAHARDLSPADPQIHFLFAMIASELELPVEARASLDRALALDPANPAFNYAMGTVILTTRDAATAGGYFKKFITVRPDDPKGHYALGVADFASGDYAGSKQEMLKVENVPKVAGGAAYFLGRIARRENDLQGSAEFLRRAIKLMPEYAESHTELARVCMLEGDLQEARTELDRALKLDPRSFQANTQLLVLMKRTRDPQAEKQSQLVKDLDEDRSRRAELMLRTIELRP